MTRKEQINKMAKEIASYITNDKDMQVAFADTLKRGAEWADSHPHWISVEDELPEVGVAVLTITPRGTQRVGFYEDGWWLANYIDLVRMGSITHWMPLPAPPSSSEIPNNCKKGDNQ